MRIDEIKKGFNKIGGVSEKTLREVIYHADSRRDDVINYSGTTNKLV